MLQRIPILCVVLSVCFASALALFLALARGDRFVQCQASFQKDTVFSLYTNSGSGYNEQEAEHMRSTARPVWRTLKFRIQNIIFKGLRLDFTSEDNEVHLKRCTVQDEYGFPLVSYQDFSLKALQQVQLVPKGTGEYVAIGQGEDPQILLDIPWTTVFVQKIQIGFWFSSVFLFYPVSFFSLDLWAEMSEEKKTGFEKTGLHRLFMGLGLVFWLLAALAWWSASSRHLFVPTREEGEGLYEALFVAREITLHRSDGLAIHGRLYQSDDSGPHRGDILLLHGNYPEGQRRPLYLLMAESLAHRGFRVLTIDLAGYGLSADPFAGDTRLRSDHISETETALAFLKASPLPGGRKHLCIIGHSLGANPALWVGLRDKDVDALVLIGPPRRIGERFYDVIDLDYFWERALGQGRLLHGRKGFPAWYSRQAFQEEFLDQDLIYALPELRRGGHKPLYFMDGGKESEEDLDFLRRYVQKVAAPCSHVTMLAADHNFNVPPDLTHLHYVPNALQDAVEVLDGWCGRETTMGWRMWYAGQNILRLLFPFR